uniref:Uncharacterized protein n=1 Tax=Meloidogyne javanica TaxID=6303 RepID=A0A915MER0_MELJA
MANSLIGVSCGMDNFDKRFGQIISSDVVHPVELTENFVEAVNEDADFVKKLVPFAADDENSNCDENKKKTTFVDFNGMPVNDPLPIFPLSMTLEDVFKTLQADVRFLPTLVALKKLNLKIPQLIINGNIGGRANRYGLVNITDANGQIVLASSGIALHKKKVKMTEKMTKHDDVYLRAIDNIKAVLDGAAAHITKLSDGAADNITKLSDNIKSVSDGAAAHIAKLSDGATAHIANVLRIRDGRKQGGDQRRRLDGITIADG